MPQLISEDDILRSSPTPPHDEVIRDSDLEINTPSRKRRRIDTSSPDDLPSQDASSSTSLFSSPTPVRLRKFEIMQSELIYPKSMYDGWAPQLPFTSERNAISDFLNDQQPTSEITIELTDFVIYRSGQGKRRLFEMVPLHHLSVEPACNMLLFDGVVTLGEVTKYVRGAQFEVMAIAGYVEDSFDTVANNITLKSTLSKSVWYHLSTPATEYRRYHETFLWVADLAKHAIDFMANEDKVTLNDFQSRFYDWLLLRHGDSKIFRTWLSIFRKKDFRAPIAANVAFLWNEAHNVNEQFKKDPLWTELNHIQHGQPVKEEQKVKRQQQQGVDGTVVTPFVFENFKHMPFAKILKPHLPSSQLAAKLESHKASLGFFDVTKIQKAAESNTNESNKAHIRTGDVVTIVRDQNSVWRENGTKWFAWIQAISKDRIGFFYNVIWLYSPADTTLAGGKYRFSNELFFSDHCNCQANKGQALRSSDILQKVSVKWVYGAAHATTRQDSDFDYFIRMKYDTDNHFFITLKETDRHCTCGQEALKKYSIGDTVLVLQGRETLDPVVVVENVNNEMVSVRRLLRRKKFHPKAKDNELVWTEDTFETLTRSVKSTCYIRFFEETEDIPVPYDRDGAGNFWYITSRSHGTSRADRRTEPLRRPFPTTMKQGFDPRQEPPRKPLNAMDLFCGGGNFGRGLAEAGGIKCLWAVDWERNAVDTYRANEAETKASIFWGSVNDYLAATIEGSTNGGSKSQLIARVGDVEFIAAGTPCQAFSSMQPDTTSQESLRNASMVASVAAFIEVYRPKYALLENVVAMTHKRRKGSSDIFPQLLCVLVAMGYQVKQFLVDAWSTGSSQSRSRLFVSIAAPGLVPLPAPTLTHSHPAGTGNSSLGENACAAKFGTRQFGPTPFKFVTASQATQDLPYIGDGHVQTCIQFPDHRLCRFESQTVNSYIKSVPISPPGMTLMKAINIVPEHIAKHFLENSSKARTSESSRSYSRIFPDGLFPTIKTAATAADAWTGRLLHWQEHRVLTIMEARRAQSFPDNEIILGTPSGQWRIIGNSVDRKVALNLGVAVREAWHANSLDDNTNTEPFVNGTQTQLNSLTESYPHQSVSRHSTPTPRPSPSHAPVIIDLTNSDSEAENKKPQSRAAPTPGENFTRRRYLRSGSTQAKRVNGDADMEGA
ncbi:uncharacterized protein K452DRAFT_354875 [Aplosporella prunicola CBS 121167]|uniref:DNA (cytosine-5-)-methyltransferase n=1 Tax=Aplosporella prunicola CBS 121167 TaxID=1176127 RepID=A0A6A6BW30_9PEZI|nr:uncharacterized protein K452DRAFT_354875 [Aplosporella prunicola CBS 121167]KAF2147505.1 hypothetical protein K452DRAFT_354875 [Aplosporella prunicola CBS 121167]